MACCKCRCRCRCRCCGVAVRHGGHELPPAENVEDISQVLSIRCPVVFRFHVFSGLDRRTPTCAARTADKRRFQPRDKHPRCFSASVLSPYGDDAQLEDSLSAELRQKCVHAFVASRGDGQKQARRLAYVSLAFVTARECAGLGNADCTGPAIKVTEADLRWLPLDVFFC